MITDTYMQIPIVAIGNSKGIRLPKALLEQLHMADSLELEVEGGKIILSPAQSNPRKGWKEAFQNHLLEKDAPWLEVSNVFDDQDWQW